MDTLVDTLQCPMMLQMIWVMVLGSASQDQVI